MNIFNPARIPLSLYIHFPWCVRKCPYCDFNSHTLQNELPVQQYIDALLEDLKCELRHVAGRPLQSIFMGGGTPSLFPAKALDRLLRHIRALIPFKPGIEITLEANPGTIDHTRFAEYRAIGINRLSLGVQSFSDSQLQRLGRIHDAQQAWQSIEVIQALDFPRWNLDLMYGLPEQGVEDALLDLKTALQFSPSHISWYQLTLEPNTVFYKYPPPLPNDDRIFSMMQRGHALLSEYGFTRYEISAHAKKNHGCQHNKNYWLFGDYIGIGAGAHGKITTPHAIIRTEKIRQPTHYLQKQQKRAKQHPIALTDQAFEFMLNALRLTEKIAWPLFAERTQLSWQVLKPQLHQAEQQGLLTWDDKGCQVTSHGHRFLNDLQGLFLIDEIPDLMTQT